MLFIVVKGEIKMKAIVVGRHVKGGNEDLEIVRQENINFPATSEECKPILKQLLDEAHEENAALIFQAVPGQVAVTIPQLLKRGFQKVGIIVSKIGPRPTGQELVTEYSQAVEEAIRFVNPQAEIEIEGRDLMKITVDPPLRFQFSHIEWF